MNLSHTLFRPLIGSLIGLIILVILGFVNSGKEKDENKPGDAACMFLRTRVDLVIMLCIVLSFLLIGLIIGILAVLVRGSGPGYSKIDEKSKIITILVLVLVALDAFVINLLGINNQKVKGGAQVANVISLAVIGVIGPAIGLYATIKPKPTTEKHVESIPTEQQVKEFKY